MPKTAKVPNLLTPKPWPCQKPVELGSGVVTYCARPRDHEGRCEPDRPFCHGCNLLARWWDEHEERV